MLESLLNAVLTGVVAPGALLLGQWALRWRQRPRLRVEVGDAECFRVRRPAYRTSADGRVIASDSVWLRLRVSNHGGSTSRNAQVFLKRFRARTVSTKMRPASEFDMTPLHWAHSEALAEAERITFSIPPRTHRFVDVVAAFAAGEPGFALRSTSSPHGFEEQMMAGEGLWMEFEVIDADGHHHAMAATCIWDGQHESLRWCRSSERTPIPRGPHQDPQPRPNDP